MPSTAYPIALGRVLGPYASGGLIPGEDDMLRRVLCPACHVLSWGMAYFIFLYGAGLEPFPFNLAREVKFRCLLMRKWINIFLRHACMISPILYVWMKNRFRGRNKHRIEICLSASMLLSCEAMLDVTR